MDITPLLKKTPLTERFSDKELPLLSSLMEKVSFETGSYLMREGEQGTFIFFIAEGEVEILKQEKETKEAYRITLLSPGSWVGEMALFSPLPRSASVRTTTPTICYSLSIPELSDFSKDKPEYIALKTKLLKYFSEQIEYRLRETNEKMAVSLRSEVESARKRIQISYFIIAFSIIIYFYALALRGISLVIKNPFLLNTFTDLLIVLFGLGVVLAIIKSKYTWSFYGVSLHNWKKYALQSFFWTIPILGLMVLLKWILIETVPVFHGRELFPFGDTKHTFTYLVLTGCVYLLLVPCQELISRGGFQSCFQNFFSGKHRMLSANLITNLYFSVFHLHQSYILALSVFILGIFWGWLYSRQRTLVGPCVSHGMVGVWGFIFLDIRTFFIF